MADRFKFAEVRQEVIEMLKKVIEINCLDFFLKSI